MTDKRNESTITKGINFETNSTNKYNKNRMGTGKESL